MRLLLQTGEEEKNNDGNSEQTTIDACGPKLIGQAHGWIVIVEVDLADE